MAYLRPLSQTKFINDANLTHYYTCDSNFNDSKGSNNGTDTNTPTYTAGKFSNAFTCASASSQYTSVANDTFPWGTNTYSVSMWVKLNSTTGNKSFSMTARTSQGLIFYVSGSSIVHSKPNVVDLTYTWTGIDTNYHLWTFVGNSSGMFTYLDGVLVASNANAANITAPSTDTITFGAYKSGGTIQTGWYLDGQIDDTAIFSRALSAGEVAELYQSMTLGEYLPNANTKLLLHLNGSSADSSGNSNNGTDTAITYSQANGKFGQGAGFNGSSSTIVTGLAGVSGTVFTYVGWFNTTSTAGAGNDIFSHSQDSNNYSDAGTTSTGIFRYFAWNGSTVGQIATTLTYNDGNWHNYVVSRNGATVNIYIDSFLAATGTSNNITVTTNFQYGKDLYNNVFFTGSMDESFVEVGTAWSAEKVKKYYTFTRGRFGII